MGSFHEPIGSIHPEPLGLCAQRRKIPIAEAASGPSQILPGRKRDALPTSAQDRHPPNASASAGAFRCLSSGTLTGMRNHGRAVDELRPFEFVPGFSKFAEGSCLLKLGDTHMLVTATVEDSVPRFLKGKGEGWLTAEYAMLARSGRQRNDRDPMRPNGRNMEIQRLIGRSLRNAVDLSLLGERTIKLDCDAIQADGGTRCAAITAGYVALAQALHGLRLKRNALREPVAAVSVGLYRNQVILDLEYDEDSQAGTDMNVVMTAGGRFIEIQGTAEEEPFDAKTLGSMLALAQKGINDLVTAQRESIASFT